MAAKRTAKKAAVSRTSLASRILGDAVRGSVPSGPAEDPSRGNKPKNIKGRRRK